MRRIRLTTGPAVLFGAMLVAALIVFLPMRLVLGWAGVGDQGVVARAVSGTIWGATLSEVKFGDLAIGDLRARLSPLPLLTGRATIVMNGPGGIGAPPLSGKASVSRNGMGVDRFTARLATGASFQPLPVSTIDLDALTVRFQDGQCVAAQGRVVAALAGESAGIALPSSVSGNARCDAGALLLPLASAGGTEAIALRITGGGRYRADLSLRPTDPAAIERLTASGFTPGPGGYRLSVEGRF